MAAGADSALAAAACMIVAAVVFPAMSQQFFTSVMWHLPGKVAFDGGFATPGNQSAQGILAAIGHGPARCGRPLPSPPRPWGCGQHAPVTGWDANPRRG